MALVHRVLSPDPITSLDSYIRVGGGGRGLRAARAIAPETIIDEIDASGLRGRGGGGFPTGRKWRAVVENRSVTQRATVVVNGAEGEPGTFKDRALLRRDPYRVLEGALIAALAVGADEVVVALKRSFTIETNRVGAAVAELDAAGWTAGVRISVFVGPPEYLYGEETALLEVLDGRPPLPRIAPPYRRGVDEVVESEADLGSRSGLPAHVELAAPSRDAVAPPTLVNNVETLANVPGIITRGAAWFRTEGTADSPGTIVCTVTGTTQRHDVGEVAMGTPLRHVIDLIGGGPRPGHRIKAVLSGVANALVPESELDAPVSYEGLAAIGSGLGSAGFMVFDDTIDLTAVAAGVSRFLAVESCGQCTPCKQDGLAIADILTRVVCGEARPGDADELSSRVTTVGDEARCALAGQQQTVMGSLLSLFPEAVRDHLEDAAAPDDPVLIASLVDIDGGRAVLDEGHRRKQPDWTFDDTYSGQSPADRLDQRLEEATSR
jgi:NADH:ubiquinone oxidoreductase subunit F (NADH-binding)